MNTTTSAANGTAMDNVTFQHEAMTSPVSYQTSDNYRTSQSEGGIAIDEGDSINITIEYDVSKFILKTVAEAALSESKSCQLSEDKLTSYCNRLGANSLTVKVN
jgi:hypothetical protein